VGEPWGYECGKWHQYHENWYGLFDYKKFKAEKGNNADSGFGHKVAEFQSTRTGLVYFTIDEKLPDFADDVKLFEKRANEQKLTNSADKPAQKSAIEVPTGKPATSDEQFIMKIVFGATPKPQPETIEGDASFLPVETQPDSTVQTPAKTNQPNRSALTPEQLKASLFHYHDEDSARKLDHHKFMVLLEEKKYTFDQIEKISISTESSNANFYIVLKKGVPVPTDPIKPIEKLECDRLEFVQVLPNGYNQYKLILHTEDELKSEAILEKKMKPADLAKKLEEKFHALTLNLPGTIEQPTSLLTAITDLFSNRASKRSNFLLKDYPLDNDIVNKALKPFTHFHNRCKKCSTPLKTHLYAPPCSIPELPEERKFLYFSDFSFKEHQTTYKMLLKYKDYLS
jgi:hypothetical protein